MIENMPSGILEKAKGMFVHFSDILTWDVVDSNGKFIGKVDDLSIKLTEIYPKTCDLIIKRGWPMPLYATVGWDKVKSVDRGIELSVDAAQIQFSPKLPEYEYTLRRDVLDNQVVDMHNHKVIRVNDIHLLKADRDLMVAHVDIGMGGLLRRLGWEKTLSRVLESLMPGSMLLKKDSFIAWKYIQLLSINPVSKTIKLNVPQKEIMNIPTADLGDIMLALDLKERLAFFKGLDLQLKVGIFEHMALDDQMTILKELDKKEAADVVSNMQSDNATDLLEELPRDATRDILALIETTRAKKISTLLGYSSDSAGGLMNTEVITVPETTTAGEALELIKKKSYSAEFLYYIYIVDEKNRLKGATNLKKILTADPKDLIMNVAFPKAVSVRLHDGVKEVAYLMDKYKCHAVAVIDQTKTLQGVITVDDILEHVISLAWRRRPRRQIKAE